MEVTPQKQTNMKKLILSIAIGILSIYSTSAQIKIIEDTSTEIGYMKLPGMDKNMTLTLDNGTYTMMYKDVQYTHIDERKSFSFTGKESLDGLYDIMTKQFKAPKKTELKFELDNSIITIITKKVFGKPYLLVMVKAEGQPLGGFNLEPKYMDKLFGKE